MRVRPDPDTKHEVIERLQTIFLATPLEIVSEVLLRYPHLDGCATKVLGAYDGFVGILSNSQQRKRLEDLKEEEADDDDTSEGALPQS